MAYIDIVKQYDDAEYQIKVLIKSIQKDKNKIVLLESLINQYIAEKNKLLKDIPQKENSLKFFKEVKKELSPKVETARAKLKQMISLQKQISKIEKDESIIKEWNKLPGSNKTKICL